jgi:serine/threonine-protein kinase
VLADRYAIERQLGRGGMATVYLARDLKHDRQVAIKVLRPEVAASIGAERFLREIRTAARLQHPHIVPLHDSGEAAGFLYYVMPYVEGESLRDLLAREPQLGLERAQDITREVAEALTYAHSQGVVHRDIKPENILISGGAEGTSGHALVADFGIARALSAAGGDKTTETGLALGTPAYMSPEQAYAVGAIDGRADTYALGCVLYEMLAGHQPFLGRTAQEVLARHSRDPVPPLRTIRPELPEAVETAVRKALAKSPADRFPTTSGLVRALTERSESPKRLSRLARWSLALTGLAVLGVLYTLVSRPSRPGPGSAPDGGPPAIAVLPFSNVGGDPANEPFSDGVADELTTALGRVEGLSVAARASAFSFKGKGLDAREIGRRLQAGYVVVGQLRRAEDRIRVSWQLIDVASGKEVWSDNVDHGVRAPDVFAVQDSIVRVIVRELGRRIPAKATEVPETRSTENPVAHDLYLKGRWFFAKRDRASLGKAQDYFEQAIKEDSSYALAYAGLSDAYSHSSVFGHFAPHEVFPRAMAAARRALELDSSLVEAHTSNAFIKVFYEWDWQGAGREFDRALTLNPSYPPAHLFHGWYLLALNRIPAALDEFRTAVRLDPFSAVNNIRLATALFLAGRYDGAIAQALQTRELEPAFFQTHSELGVAYVALGRCAEAIQELESGREDRVPLRYGALGYAYARCGRGAQALAELDRLAAERTAGLYVSHYSEAMIYAGLLDKERAFVELDSAYAERAFPLIFLRLDPAFEGLRGDHRFAALLAKVGPPP